MNLYLEIAVDGLTCLDEILWIHIISIRQIIEIS